MSRQQKIDSNLLTICISAGIIFILFLFSPVLELINKDLYGQYLGVKNTFLHHEKLPEIIVIEIDDTSLEKIGTFPFPRSLYAQSLDTLQSSSPASIGYDILFLDASDEKEDEILKKSFNNYDNIVLGASINGKGQLGTNIFEQSSGYLPVRVAALNNTVYSFIPQYSSGNQGMQEHFTLAILRKYYANFFGDQDFESIGKYTKNTYEFSDNISFLLSEENSDDILINYDNNINITLIPFFATLDKNILKQYVSDESLKDSIILIGPAAEGFGDTFYTPYGRLFGLHIHAHIISTLLSKNFLTYFDAFTEWCMIFLLIILGVFINLSSKKYILIIGNFCIILLFLGVIPVILLGYGSIILRHPSEIGASVILAIASANIVKYIVEKGHKRRLGKALSDYVGANIADEILLEHGKVNLDGEKRELVCFFSDIQGFTELSEKLGAESVVAFLREYLAEMTHVITAQKGHIDKFEGDAIMALWGAFKKYSEEDCINACHTALKQQSLLKSISEKNKKLLDGRDLKIRIGIHEGEAIIGNIGARGEKMEFTALGDTVNLASRLEGVNKYYGTYICVSEQIHEVTSDIFAYRFLDEIRVKGKHNSVKIYELLGYKKDISEEELQAYMKFSRAINLYKKGDFSKALSIFQDPSLQHDTPSEVFGKRCVLYQKTPPHDWDGIWDMEEK